MISAAHLWTVGYTVAGISVAAYAAGALALRLLAGRSVATILTVIAAVTISATLASVIVIAMEMLISRQDRDLMLAVIIVAGFAGFAVALAVGRKLSAASRLLHAAVRDVGAGGQFRPPRALLPAELAGLSAELEVAHGRLAEARGRERALEASRRELVAWVSHDLRTPLAGLRAMAEALEDGVVSDAATVARYYAQIRRETDRLTLMIDDLFELSRIHAGALRLSREAIDLGDVIGEALTSAEPLARSSGVHLDGRALAALPVCVDSAEVGRAVRELLINAIRHTPPGGAVEILGDQESGLATVSVSDCCGGIPDEQLARVFDVAFRGDIARTPAAGEGAGLGLSIAQGIIQAHDGHVTVRNTGRGCEFLIRLPLAARRPELSAPGSGPPGQTSVTPKPMLPSASHSG
jgi:signal transduction histidine kinase